jgi:hypothetical protein
MMTVGRDDDKPYSLNYHYDGILINTAPGSIWINEDEIEVLRCVASEGGVAAHASAITSLDTRMPSVLDDDGLEYRLRQLQAENNSLRQRVDDLEKTLQGIDEHIESRIRAVVAATF